tara:strand:+ start:598 stop:840 length:243 start_codon:yes stop_codon:yes gene_type:complete
MVTEELKPPCTGCQESVYTVEYHSAGIFIGDYCVTCMTCPLCGIDLDVNSLGQMIFSKSFQSELLHIPAKYCAKCMKDGV